MAKAKAKLSPQKKIKEVTIVTAADRKARLAAVTASVNRALGAVVVQRAEALASSHILRRPTGILSLDLKLQGGFPASAITVIVGPDGAGKDYLLWSTAAECQKIYGDDFAMAVYLTESRLDKTYMKDICGFQVGMSEAELEEEDLARDQAGLLPMTDDVKDYYRQQVGNLYVILGVSAEEGFDAIIEYIESNACQIVAVNSIGFLQTEAKEKTDSFKEFAQRSSEASLLTKWAPKLAMTLNRDVSAGERNETSIILIDQVRAADAKKTMPGRIAQDKDKYRPASGAWALKHGKAVELSIYNGSKIYDLSVKPPVVLGREKTWEVTKGKLGLHEGIRGDFSYFFETGADRVGDLVTVCKSLGVLEGTTWLQYEHEDWGFKIQGEARTREHIQETEGLMDHLREVCLRKSGIVYRHR